MIAEKYQRDKIIMKKPLVSICIPTFNRCEQLEQTLESIVHQPEILDGRAEVIISDNASTDNTETVGRKYADKYENVSYFRNKENVRDKNFPLVLSKANGILRKLNNDTLVLNADILGNLCSIVQKYQDTRPSIFLTNGRHKTYDEKLFNFHDFVVTEGFWVTWIGSFTIWEDECINIETDFEGTELSLWQVKKLLENTYRKNSAVVCDQKFGKTLSLPKKDISYGLYQVFYKNYMTLLRPYVENCSLSSDDMEVIEKDLLYNFFTGWIVKWELKNKELQYSETENLKELVFEQYKDKPYWDDYQSVYNKALIRAKNREK